MDMMEMKRNEVTCFNDVEVLIDKVRAAHREAKAYASKAIERAYEAGDLLLLIKPTIKHGEWEAFLSERLPEVGIRQAQTYMKLARELPVEKRTGSFLTIKGALRALEPPEDQPESKLEDEPDTCSMVDHHYDIFLERKSELLNSQMNYEQGKVWNSMDWLIAHKDIKDDRQGLRSYALNVINHSSLKVLEAIQERCLKNLSIMII